MSQKMLAEAVSQYVDHLGIRDEEYLSVFGGWRRDLEPLLGVIRLLRAVLLPVEPSPEFTAVLRSRLASAPAIEVVGQPSRRRERIIVGAAALASVVSAAAIIFMFTRARARAA